MAFTLETPSGRITVNADSAAIGRDRSCQIALPNEQSLQPIHATIKKIAGRWLIEAAGDWLIQVGKGVPGRKSWLNPGGAIRLTQVGPELVFEPPTTTNGPKGETRNAQVVAGGEWLVAGAATGSKVKTRNVPPPVVKAPPPLTTGGVPPVPTAPFDFNAGLLPVPVATPAGSTAVEIVDRKAIKRWTSPLSGSLTRNSGCPVRLPPQPTEHGKRSN